MTTTTTNEETTKDQPKMSSADHVLAIAAELTAAKRAYAAEEARKMHEARQRTADAEAAREAAKPKPAPLPANVAQLAELYEGTLFYLTSCPRLMTHDPEAPGVVSTMTLALRVLERARDRYHAAELERLAAENQPAVYVVSPTMQRADDVLIIGSSAFSFGGAWEIEGERPRVVRMAGLFGFVPREAWEGGLRELHEKSRAEFLRRKRNDVARAYGGADDLVDTMAERLASSWAVAADQEVGFAVEGDARWDLRALAGRWSGLPNAPDFGRIVEELIKRCSCSVLRVRWLVASRDRGASVPLLETWAREEENRVGEPNVVPVREAFAFWERVRATEADTTA